MSKLYSIDDVCRLTGLEASEIRFYESVFREFLQFTRMGLDHTEFNEDHVKILKQIRELIHHRGLSIEDVKKELRPFFQGKGGSRQKAPAATPKAPLFPPEQPPAVA